MKRRKAVESKIKICFRKWTKTFVKN